MTLWRTTKVLYPEWVWADQLKTCRNELENGAKDGKTPRRLAVEKRSRNFAFCPPPEDENFFDRQHGCRGSGAVWHCVCWLGSKLLYDSGRKRADFLQKPICKQALSRIIGYAYG